jgi:putative sugar O-methyltransferase
VIVNSDTCSYQERMTLLHSAGVLQRLRGLGRPARVLEIGGGYGALSLAVRRALPDCAYTICDLPESLLFSGLYLSLVGDEPVSMFDGEPRPGTVSLLPNYLFHDLGTPFDLVINTLSMSEMSAYQIRAYAAGIKVLIGETGLFFEQNHDSRPAGLEFAAPLMMPFFQHGAILMIEVGLTLGHANLWANTAAALPG